MDWRVDPWNCVIVWAPGGQKLPCSTVFLFFQGRFKKANDPLFVQGWWMWSWPLPCGWSTRGWSCREPSSGTKTSSRPSTRASLVCETFTNPSVVKFWHVLFSSRCTVVNPCCVLGFSPLRCFLADRSQWGCGDSVERHPALSYPRPQPGCAVHDLWGDEEEGGQRREEGERAWTLLCGTLRYRS